MSVENEMEESGLPEECLQARLHADDPTQHTDRHLGACAACAKWVAKSASRDQALRQLAPQGISDRPLRILTRARDQGVEWPFRIEAANPTAPVGLPWSGVSRRAKGRSQAARKISVAAGILAALLLLSVGMWLGRHQAMVQQGNEPVLDAPARLAAFLELSRSCSDEVEKVVRSGPPVAAMMADAPAHPLAMGRPAGAASNRFADSPVDPVGNELDRLAVALKLLAPKLLDAARALPEPNRKESLASLAADWQRQESLYLRLATDHADRRPKLQELAAIARGAREDALREHALI
jgi:hypothetical protein